MHFTTIFTSALSMVTLPTAAPAVTSDPPELEALFRELRDYRCETGGIKSRAIYTPEAGKCLKFKNKDTAGVKRMSAAKEAGQAVVVIAGKPEIPRMC